LGEEWQHRLDLDPDFPGDFQLLKMGIGRLTGLILLCAFLAGCGGPAEPVWAPDDSIREYAFAYDGPSEIRLYTVVSKTSGSGAHSGLLIAAPGERILFDPAGSFKLPIAPERNDVHHAMTDRAVAVYVDYHARETHDVIEQRMPVTAAQARALIGLAKAYGPVPKAQCSLSISRILDQVPGFDGVPVTYFPKAVSKRFGDLPGVSTRTISDDDADKNHNVLIRAAASADVN